MAVMKQLYWGLPPTKLKTLSLLTLSPQGSIGNIPRQTTLLEQTSVYCRVGIDASSLQNNHLLEHPKLAVLRLWEKYKSQQHSNEHSLRNGISKEPTPLTIESFFRQPA